MDSLIKPYNDTRASFGRHETFSLRYAWLTTEVITLPVGFN
jgi:hypothetical protein